VSVQLLVVGEALIDDVHTPDGSRRRHPGGSPLNVAVGLARLGRSVGLLTRYGSDNDGALLAGYLAQNDVPLVGIPVDGQPTSVAEAWLDRTGAATYDFRLHWDLPDSVAESVADMDLTAVHTGSIAAVVGPGADRVLGLVTALRERATFSYDPNCRPVLMGSPVATAVRVERLVALADVVKVSTEDLEWLYAERPWQESARGWLGSGSGTGSPGPAVVVVTRGAEGSWAACAAGEVSREPVPIEVVDTVGAGDSFQAGLLDGLYRRGLLGVDAQPDLRAIGTATLDDVLADAALIAALTVGRPGADPPTAAEVAAHTPDRVISTDGGT